MNEAWGELVKVAAEILKKRSFQDGDPDDEVFRMWAIRIREAADRMKNTRPAPNVPTPRTPAEAEALVDAFETAAHILKGRVFCQCSLMEIIEAEENLTAARAALISALTGGGE